MEHSELQTKYQKLATEYAKLRAQNQVLKKAVVEEQAKSCQNKESLKLQDQSVRKLEQELDSTSFRNQQLLKRLSILQDELDELQMKGSKKQVAGSTVVLNNDSIYMEELQLKIEENINLHSKLTNMENIFKGRITELETMESALKQDIVRTIDNFKNKEESLKGQIRDLENEKVISEVTLQQKKPQLTFNEDKYNEDSKNISLTGSNKKEKNELAIGNFNVESKKKEGFNLKIVMKLFEQSVFSLCCGFCSFLKNYSLDVKQISSALTTQSKQLKDEEKVWQNLSTTFANFSSAIEKSENSQVQLEEMPDLQHVSKAITNCASSLRKVLPLLTEKYGSNNKMDAPWRSALGRFVSCWAAVTTNIASFSAISEKRSEINSINVAKLMNSLDEKLQRLYSSSLDLISSWQTFYGYSEENGVRKSLEVIKDALENISSLFYTKVLPQWNQVCSTPSTPSSVSVCTPINTHPPILSHDVSGWSGNSVDSLPYSDTSLVQQITMATSRVSKLEEEKEHWKLEYQLLSHRLQTEKVQGSQKSEDTVSNIEEKSELYDESDKSGGIISPSILAEVTGELSFEEREAEISTHYKNRCSNLHKQLAWATCQAALFQNECENIMKRLEISETMGASTEKEIESLRGEISQLQETLQTTSRNYEEQISTMSEHLADLNDKLTSQEEIIENLLYHQKKKTKK